MKAPQPVTVERAIILVVDDVPDARQLIVRILQQHGFATIEAASGSQAVDIVKNHREIDLVLLDIVLPDISGFEVMQELAPLKEKHGFKVCFVSGRKDRDGVLKAIESGGDDYLVKPIYPDALVAKVSLILGIENLSDGYNKVKCMLKAKLLASPIQPDLAIVEITEMTVVIRSTAGFREEMQLEVQSPKLNHYLKTNQDSFTLKVIKCKRASYGKYYMRCRFVGIPESTVTEIRSLAIRGKFLS